ncbi:hypothetical protein FQR65_LT07798 [Abscondita terminalis]|nr:hypothetical protein FQR65_LT07798 [Abscondita terminalis]
MEQIYLKKWIKVLLEWVNCLKLSEPIQDLKDLKDGSFFDNLLKLIIPIDSDTTNHVFARTDEFLKKQYPHISLNYDNENVAESDLIIICSLLLHYSCIHDRRDVLTSPLCYQLSKQTQTTIKGYLEKTKNDINLDKLFDIIEASFEWKKENKSLNDFTLSCDYSNVASPLQALLHTPVSKGPRYKEKDREINKLRSELDLERFEKIDLQKELSEEKDKNKNLCQQIHNKTTEITQLHNEISELETKIASNNCDIEWSKLQQKLRNENKSLEKYISQLHTEQEKVCAEKDEAKEKMKKFQEECNFWQEKAMSYESNYENLSENYKQQQLELHDLRDNCRELSNLLEELQSTNRPNDSCDDVDGANNFRKKNESLSSTEDLACVVVEVQLRDVQKENIKLNKSLKDCQENIVKLNSEIHSFKIKIKELEGDKEILGSENEDLQSKVAMLITTREILDRTKSKLQETVNKLEDVSNHNEFLTTNVIIKDKQLIELSNSLQSLCNCNAALKCNVQTLQEENKNIESVLKECSEKLHISNTECENSKKSFVELKSEITVALKKFEDFVFGVSKLDLNNFESSFSTILHELESDRIRQLKDKQLGADAVARLEKLVAMQKSQLVALNEREQSYLTDIGNVTDSLKKSKEEVSVLEETISNYVNKIKFLNSTISDMKLTQAELDMNKVGLEEKITNLENQIQVYSNNEGIFKRVVSEICGEDQSLTFDKCLEILQLAIKNLEENVETLTLNLDDARTVIAQSNSSEKNFKKKLIKQSKITKANYENEISSLKQTLGNCEDQLVNLTSSECKLEERIKESGAEIEHLKAVVSLKKIELFERNKHLQSHQNYIKSLKNENENLRNRNGDLYKQCVNFEKTKNQLEEKLKNLESHMENVVKELFSKNEELDAIIVKDKEYKELYEAKLSNLEENLSKTNTVINLQRKDLNDYKNQVSNLNQEIVLLIDAESRCKSELHEVKNQLNVTVSNYTETLQSHRELQAESESQINTLTENLHELVKKYNILDSTHQDTIKQLKTALDEYKNNETILKEDGCNRRLEFEAKETELVEQLVKTKEKLYASKNSNEEMLTSFQQLCVAFAHEKLNAHKMLENLNVVRSTYKQLKNSFEELKCDLQSLPNKNSKCWNTLNIQLTDCFKSLNDENCNLKKSKSELQMKLSALEDDCRQTKADLKKFQQRDQEITKENKSQKEALNVLIMEKEELQKEISAKHSKLNDMINHYKFKLNEFQEVNNVLTVDKCSLEERIKEISSLDLLRTKEILALEGLINSKDDEIKVLLGAVGVKNTEVEELGTRNKNLESELVHLKEAFDSEVEKLNTFEQVVEKQKEVREELSSEIEKLKETVETVFVERQALKLEIEVANKKITEFESLMREKETDIAEVNTKLLTKLEKIVDLEKCKQALQIQIDELNDELSKIIKEKDEITQNVQMVYEDAINERTKLEKTAAEQHYLLMKQNEDLRNELHYLNETQVFLQNEKVAIEMKLSNIIEENLKLSELLLSFKMNVQNLIHTLSETPFDIEEATGTVELSPTELENIKSSMELLREKILRIKEQNKLNNQEMSVVVEEKLKMTRELEETAAQIATIENGKQQLLQNYKNLQVAHEVCKAKYEQLREYHEKNKSRGLEDNLVKLENKVSVIQDTYKKFAGHSKSFHTAIDKLINERNFLENLVGNTKYNIMCLQSKVSDVKDEREGLKLKEQIEAFEFIVEDLQKQFLQISKKTRSIILNVVEIPSKMYDIIVGEKFTETSALFDNLSFEEELEKITDCRDAANNLLEQVNGFEATLGSKLTKMNKENVLKSSSNIISDVKVKDEDLKKKNTVLKQRLTLSENAKSNLEKKIKQLRQENKLLQDKSENSMEAGYKALLQQHIELKEKFEKIQSSKVLQENENPKTKPKILFDQTKQEKVVKLEQNIKVEKEVVKLRNAYSNLMGENSRLNLESNSLKKLLEERTQELDQLNMIKEAYEKLLEENNTFRMELDTIKYKRNKDKEALMEATKKIHDLKTEYEVKLEKMKEKTVQLYREEMNRENLKFHHEKLALMKKLTYQQSILDRKPAPHIGKCKEFSSCDNESYSSGDSFFITPDLHSTRNSYRSTENLTTNKYKRTDGCKCATLPKTGGMHRIAENQNHKRNPQHRSKPIIGNYELILNVYYCNIIVGRSLEMEDEDDDLFNNKYLADLKEGRCTLPSERESNANRLSELKWRNSLYPPHLKSSYPAETQFSNLADFKEEDIKTGAFSDSMTAKLIQGDKPRKKDIGTTSYKKPGPPTPSKNGGRTSLQGNEREVLRENCGAPKRSTPSRLKHFILGRSTSSKDNSENQPGTPRSKRLSIFRKQK